MSAFTFSAVLIAFVIVFLIGVWIGWTYAHHVIAVGCERLGWFCVGKSVYKCVKQEG